MSKADRIVAQRDAQQRRDAAQQKADQERAEARRIADIRAELDSTIPGLIRRLEAAGAPDAILVRVARWSHGRGPKVKRAAWKVGTYEYNNRDATATGYLYILSDGRLLQTAESTGWPESAWEQHPYHLEKFLKGVRELAAKYPA